MKTDIYETVTAQILAELEAGAAPWVQPWSNMAFSQAVPANATTGRAYSGINVVLLWMRQAATGYTASRWLTFKQALDAGGNVRKGEKGSTVVYVNSIEKEVEGDNGDTKTHRIPFLKKYTVFNIAQCDGLPDDFQPPAPEAINPDQRDAAAETFMARTGATIHHGGGRAFYRPSTDDVTLPEFDAFNSADHYYATAFHELGHWTGHKSRLDRSMRARFGDQAYAAEELIAELTAAFLCAEHGFDGDLRHAGYIESWIKLLKSDKRAFFTAAAQAQKAADHLRNLQEPARAAA